MRPHVGWCMVLMVAIATSCQGRGVQVMDSASPDLATELATFDQAVRDVRIVLLGENGHGVREHTETKVRLVEWLHREHDFNLVVFESGFFECARASERVEELEPASTLQSCLRYPMEHAELLPLFELARESAGSDRPLRLGGMDLQAQGFDSAPRPEASARWLAEQDPMLAGRIARADSALFLVPQDGGMGDSLYQYAYENADSLREDYRRAAVLTDGWSSWSFRLAEAWVERLAARGAAEANGESGRPTEYYQLRDEWMARAIAAHADSIGEPEKVVVWLHNDHARYGRFPAASGDSIRSTGAFLRDWYGEDVFSVGFFFGRGEIADNARRTRIVAPMPPDGLESFLAVGRESYVVLRSNRRPEVQEWAASPQAYLRMGLDTLTLTPGHEFDALVYIDSVGAPTFDIPPGL